MNTDPKPITPEEWREIAVVPEVRDAWGITDKEPPDALLTAYVVYGAKFDFQSGGPGYSGDLYIILGDALTDPMTLIRVQGQLKVA